MRPNNRNNLAGHMTSFSDLSLDTRVLQAVTESGYDQPTPIQQQAIPHALAGEDVLGIAQTGTGKTASFVLPMLTHLSKGRARARMPRSLVLAPTRELAAQVGEQFEKYSAHLKLTMALLIGGVSFKDQDKLIDRGVDVLIATPGRLLDHFERGKLMLTGVQIMVVDEADRMLDMGFIPDIERIFKLVPFTRQTLFFSATMAPEITRITEEFLHNPKRVEVARQATTSETITQAVCKHKPSRKDRADSEKRAVLRVLIQAEGDALTNGIVFCNRKRDVDIVAKSLKKHGFDAAALHGDLEQKLRMQILGRFRDGELKLLIASDVAARGLDIPSVSHVFNYDVPIHSEDYVHRIGRTGRAGRDGKAVTLCLPFEEKHLEKIEQLVGASIPVIPSPVDRSARKSSAGSDQEETQSGRGRRGSSRRKSGEETEAASQDEAAKSSGSNQESRREGSSRRGGRNNGGRRNNGNGGNGPVVVGMGDHVPAFLLREIRFEKSDAPATDEPSQEQEATPATDSQDEAAVKPAETSGTDAATDSEAQASDTSSTETEKPKRKPRKPRKTSSRSKKSAKDEDTGDGAETPVSGDSGPANTGADEEKKSDSPAPSNDTGSEPGSSSQEVSPEA